MYTFWPENSFASQKEKSQLDFLLERKEQLYENLRDLSFEHRAGKYPEEDFQAQRALLENEAAQLVAEIERLQGLRLLHNHLSQFANCRLAEGAALRLFILIPHLTKNVKDGHRLRKLFTTEGFQHKMRSTRYFLSFDFF